MVSILENFLLELYLTIFPTEQKVVFVSFGFVFLILCKVHIPIPHLSLRSLLGKHHLCAYFTDEENWGLKI